jgi:hypothetical protein
MDDNFEACALQIDDATTDEIQAIVEKVFSGDDDVMIEENEAVIFEAFSACMETKEGEALAPTYETDLGVSETLEERLVNLDKRVAGIISRAESKLEATVE